MKSYLSAYKRKRTRLIVGLLLALLIVLSLLSYMVWSAYGQAMHEAEVTTRDFAALIESRLEATLRRADAELAEIQRNFPREALDREAVPRHVARWNAEFDARLATFPSVVGLRIFDAGGDLLYSSGRDQVAPVNIADTGHFRRVKASPERGRPEFSDVLTTRTSEQDTLVIARGLYAPDGRFLGMAAIGVHIRHFLDLFRTLDLGPGGNVAVYRNDDFRLVMRWPQLPDKVNRPLPEHSPTRAALAGGRDRATIEIQSAADGTVRIYSYRVAGQYPFFVSVGVSRHSALAGWRSHSLMAGLFAASLLILLAVLIFQWLRAESAVARFNVELEDRVRARTAEVEAFSYSISHDLRTPLRGISGIARLFETDYAASLDDAGRDMLRRMRESAIRMGELIEDLLRLSRLTRLDIVPETVDLAGVARDIAGRLRQEDPRRQVNFVFPERFEACCDRRLIEVVLENLIGNAWKFTGKRENARIEFGVNDGKGMREYFVRDNGAGFDPAHAGHLFTPFHRLHRDDEFPGTGIGLATVQRIIERHGGSVRAAGSPGEGATFFFTLKSGEG